MDFPSAYGAPYNGVAPAESDEFSAILNGMSRAELEVLFNDQEALRKMAKSSASVKKCFEEKEAIMKENRALADANLAMEPEFICVKQELSCAYDRLNEVQERHRDLLSEIGSNSGSRRKVGYGHLDVDTFLKEFVPLRKLYHERCFKTEKLQEQLSSGGTVDTFRARKSPVRQETTASSSANVYRAAYPSLRDY